MYFGFMCTVLITWDAMDKMSNKQLGQIRKISKKKKEKFQGG